jgi:hypothetical protein
VVCLTAAGPLPYLEYDFPTRLVVRLLLERGWDAVDARASVYSGLPSAPTSDHAVPERVVGNGKRNQDRPAPSAQSTDPAT